ncbi:alpha/beta hydrolase [Argonema antarcticum]|uniref:alpha/beta hydrolase n=1 Tax=Argonema antarcticum TaxID=2942763 RepID=UPI002013195B|nr:alpha/beta hydrolase [Argonema antarcticum]MCL1473075.1 alpha/beta hydrolase [Argonema antarcticum A004/B2]
MSLEVITIPATSGKPPAGAIVSLHGWGANAEDLASVTPLLNLPDYEFLFPNAPFPHPHTSEGKAWYDFQKNSSGLSESRQLLTDWLTSLESRNGIPLDRTILSGFSQGGAMTLDVGLNLPLAGLVCLSGYLHPVSEAATNRSFPPVLIVHGRQDSIVPLNAAMNARDTLSSLGVAVQYQEFDMGHQVTPAVLNVMRSFVLQVMSSASPKVP